ncbi:hypothetical protein [Enterococcus sp. N249-2]
MSDEQNKLVLWFKKEQYLGKSYDQCIQMLLDIRKVDAEKNDKLEKIYSIFVYLTDKEWEEVKSLIITVDK